MTVILKDVQIYAKDVEHVLSCVRYVLIADVSVVIAMDVIVEDVIVEGVIVEGVTVTVTVIVDLSYFICKYFHISV